METIKILPHHALSYFEFHYLKRDPDKYHQWYDSQRNRDEAVKRVEAVLNNPTQLVELVSGYDDWCRFCPYYQHGENFDHDKKPCVRDGWNVPAEFKFAKILGLEEALDKAPIAAKEFFERMKPTYEKLIAEPMHSDKNSNEYTLRQQFRYYEFPPTNFSFNISEEIERLKEKAKRMGIDPKFLDNLQ